MTHAPRCLKCNVALPYADVIGGGDRKPNKGDFAICFECGAAMVYEGVSFRFPTPEELTEPDDIAVCLAALTAAVIRLDEELAP